MPFWVELLGRIMPKQYKKKNNLELRGNVWYIRWDIPSDVRHAFNNKRILKKALGRNETEARLQSFQLLHDWKALVLQVRSGEYDPNKETKTALIDVKTAYELHRDDIALNVYKATGAIKEEFNNSETAKKMLQSWQAEYDLHESNTFGAYRSYLLSSISKIIEFITPRIGKNVSTGDIYDFHELETNYQKELQLAFISDQTESTLPYDEIRSLSRSVQIPNRDELRHGMSDSAINSWKIAMKEQFKHEKTMQDYYSKLKKFQSYMNENKKDFSYITVAEFIKSVSPMKQTQSSYVGVIRKFWKWALKNQPGFAKIHANRPDPTLEHQYPKHGKNRGEHYKAFTIEEVGRLFETCLYKRKPDLELATLIAYGLLTGARLEEIGRINKGNTIYGEDGQMAFKIEDSKTQAGIREVPIHAELQSLHEFLLDSKDGLNSIFTTRKTIRGTQLDHLSKRFGRLKTELGFEKLHVFHSLRKTFITELYENNIRHELIQRIVGHAGDNITTAVYLQDFSFLKKLEAVNTIQPPFDISKLTSFWRAHIAG